MANTTDFILTVLSADLNLVLGWEGPEVSKVSNMSNCAGPKICYGEVFAGTTKSDSLDDLRAAFDDFAPCGPATLLTKGSEKGAKVSETRLRYD